VRLRALLALAALASLGSGCMIINRVEGNEVPDAQVSRIQPGVTTRAEILDWFGAPIFHTDPSGLRMVLERGEVLPEDLLQFPYADVLVFERSRMRERRLFLLLFIYFEGRRVQDRLVVFFDRQDRVMYYGYRRGSDALQ
jgi:hypothetical protein